MHMEKFILMLHLITLLFQLQIKKVKLFLGLLLVKWDLEDLKKNTPYAAQLAAEDAVKVANEAGMRKAKVYVKGPGNGRESAIRTIHNNGIEVTEIFDVTPQPHNGCRPPKRRRV